MAADQSLGLSETVMATAEQFYADEELKKVAQTAVEDLQDTLDVDAKLLDVLVNADSLQDAGEAIAEADVPEDSWFCWFMMC